jgi:hypothetical protein
MKLEKAVVFFDPLSVFCCLRSSLVTDAHDMTPDDQYIHRKKPGLSVSIELVRKSWQYAG